MGTQAPQLSPEEVRQKWDALLAVINSVAADGGSGGYSGGEGFTGGEGKGRSSPSTQMAARELLQSGAAIPRTSPSGSRNKDSRKPSWDNRHGLLFSTVNDKMQKNIRSYFDRPRDVEAYGCRHDPPLRTTWQLDTPLQQAPGVISLSPTSAKAMALKMSRLSRSASAPGFKVSGTEDTGSGREAQWDARHHVLFTKDNHTMHANLRDYFERPRDLAY
ncbi:unnamed protein product [Polarella glacialis]|uniref:Uncharacterized protein n=1 Tax=Polarella glacialis TaxID=89957 RepID=A0A813HJL4_POLGL|nr:unnamed protein product [Polarella glacialis]CAE8638163.1 unnamed protein product [Polarella glacialis]|mmetsp:Transcript_63060/g.102163  ORF Transcript_63060/g.102163 Transcript_63060/m.102163 type:complete len:218 (-) Transcript_63060:157-810(-)